MMGSFVYPTMRGWIVGFAGITWILVAMVNHMVFPYLMGCAALALFAASCICAALSLRGLDLRRGPAGDAATGETVGLPLTITNLLRRRRQPIVITEELPFAGEPSLTVVVPPLSAREERVVPRRFLAVGRGEFDLGTVVVRGGDPAGLFCRQKRYILPGRLVVFPGTEPVPDLLLSHSEVLHSIAGGPVSAAGVSQEFYGVREYHSTDGLRHIHWASSARSGRLMVREFERNAVTSVGVIVDADESSVSGREYWSNLEYQIRAAASIARYCSSLYCTFGLALAGASVELVRPGLATDVLGDVMMALTRLQPGTSPVTEAAFALTRELSRGSVVFCFSLGPSEKLAAEMDVIAHQGMRVRWYCAERDAFAVAGGRSAAAPQTTHGSRGVPGQARVVAAQLRPGMRLEEALA